MVSYATKVSTLLVLGCLGEMISTRILRDATVQNNEKYLFCDEKWSIVIGIFVSWIVVLMEGSGEEFLLLIASRMWDCGTVEFFEAEIVFLFLRMQGLGTEGVGDLFEVLEDIIFFAGTYDGGTVDCIYSLRCVYCSLFPIFLCELILFTAVLIFWILFAGVVGRIWCQNLYWVRFDDVWWNRDFRWLIFSAILTIYRLGVA